MKTNKTSPTRVYMGCGISRTFPGGMYYALTSKGRVMADTLGGVKQLIAERERPKTRPRTGRID